MDQTQERPVDLELLSAYVDGELTEEERARVETQLSISAVWRDELETLRWTVNLLGAVPVAPLPRSFELPEPALEPAVASRPTTPAPPVGARPVNRPTAPLTTGSSQAGRWRDTRWLYSALRGATAITVALFLAVVSLDAVSQGGASFGTSVAQAPAPAALSAREGVSGQAPAAPLSPPNVGGTGGQSAAPTTADAAPAAPASAPKAATQAEAPVAAQEAKKANAPTDAPKAAPLPLQGPLAAPPTFPQAPAQQGGGGGAGGSGAGGGAPEGIPLDAQLANKQTTPATASQSATTTQGPAAQAPYAVTVPAPATAPAAVAAWSPWRLLALALGGLALMFGVGALLARGRLEIRD